MNYATPTSVERMADAETRLLKGFCNFGQSIQQRMARPAACSL